MTADRDLVDVDPSDGSKPAATAAWKPASPVLLDAIHRQFGDDAATVPSFNDAHRSGRVPMRVLTQAADLANTHGL